MTSQKNLLKQENNNIFEIFNFSNSNVRIHCINGECFVCAKDICETLGIIWKGSETLNKIPSEWQLVLNLRTSDLKGINRGDKETIFLNQKGVMKLTFRSNKPEADKFVNWVWVCEILNKLSRGETVSLKEDLPHPNPNLEMENALLKESLINLRNILLGCKEKGTKVWLFKFLNSINAGAINTITLYNAERAVRYWIDRVKTLIEEPEIKQRRIGNS